MASQTSVSGATQDDPNVSYGEGTKQYWNHERHLWQYVDPNGNWVDEERECVENRQQYMNLNTSTGLWEMQTPPDSTATSQTADTTATYETQASDATQSNPRWEWDPEEELHKYYDSNTNDWVWEEAPPNKQRDKESQRWQYWNPNIREWEWTRRDIDRHFVRWKYVDPNTGIWEWEPTRWSQEFDRLETFNTSTEKWE